MKTKTILSIAVALFSVVSAHSYELIHKDTIPGLTSYVHISPIVAVDGSYYGFVATNQSGLLQSQSMKRMNNQTPTDTALRRKAARQGYKLIKIREASRWFNQYGPFMIADATTNCAVQYGMTAEEVNGWLTSDEPTPVVVGAGEAL